MANIKCPKCGEAKLEKKEIACFQTMFEGVAISVPQASISQCPKCGEQTVSGRELKRWKEIKEEGLLACGAVPTGAHVKGIRSKFGLSVSDLAALLAVTRQTVHAWEKSLTDPMKLGPASLLVSLLQRSQPVNIPSSLAEYAAIRGNNINLKHGVLSDGQSESTRTKLKPSPKNGAASWRRAA